MGNICFRIYAGEEARKGGTQTYGNFNSQTRSQRLQKFSCLNGTIHFISQNLVTMAQLPITRAGLHVQITPPRVFNQPQPPG
jgi:hypothetical protein